jgi:8-amino-7-oxononanoate synthase
MRDGVTSLENRWDASLNELASLGRLRSLRTPSGHDFSSNDYLGYAKQSWPDASLSRSGAASRLLRGHHPLWDEVEAGLADWHGTEAALVFTSGYAANEGLLSTILEPNDCVLSDQLNHASIIDGLRLAKAEKIIFRHNDLNDLESHLHAINRTRTPGRQCYIVTESLFGMEGDVAPLYQISELAAKHGAYLVVDEAHATGCFGDTGSGLVDALGLRDRVLAAVHTGGKALGVPGAYVTGSRLLRDVLVNRCRHFIFTTALPPQVADWWLSMLHDVRLDRDARSRLHANAAFFRERLAASGLSLGGSHYLVPVVIGDDAPAMQAAQRLQDAGFDIRAIRPPTVPAGTARLRISIHADHDPELLAQLTDTLALNEP